MLADQPTFLREAPASPSRRIYERRLQVAVGVFCLLVLGLFWATLLTYLNQVETTAADQAQRDVSNLTLAVEEQVKRTILGLERCSHRLSRRLLPKAGPIWFRAKAGQGGQPVCPKHSPSISALVF
jgi:4-amino-4-deoxy-L-arabinose transferase-like glycosyltransferase